MKNLFKILSTTLFLFMAVFLFQAPSKIEAAPTVWIKANGVSNSLSVVHGNTVKITWGSSGATQCYTNFSDDIWTLGQTEGTYEYSANSATPSSTFTVTCTDYVPPAQCDSFYLPLVTCFTADTMVTMSDGTKKNIQDVKVGDVLKGETSNNKVLRLHQPKLSGKLYSINGGRYFVTEEHPFKTTDGWKSINPSKTAEENLNIIVTKLEIGDVLVTENDLIKIKTINSKGASFDTDLYNFALDGDHTYYADGYLVHNKVECNDGEQHFCSGTTRCVDGSGQISPSGTCAPCPGTCPVGYSATCAGGSTLCTQINCSVADTGVCQGTVAGSKTCTGTPNGPYEGQSCSIFNGDRDGCLSTGCNRWLTHGCSWLAS